MATEVEQHLSVVTQIADARNAGGDVEGAVVSKEMRVHVPEARKEAPPGAIDSLGAGRKFDRAVRSDRRNPIPFDQDAEAVPHGRALRVEESYTRHSDGRRGLSRQRLSQVSSALRLC
jgi:hypothetical protein